jgi:hypothetical protein
VFLLESLRPAMKNTFTTKITKTGGRKLFGKAYPNLVLLVLVVKTIPVSSNSSSM